MGALSYFQIFSAVIGLLLIKVGFTQSSFPDVVFQIRQQEDPGFFSHPYLHSSPSVAASTRCPVASVGVFGVPPLRLW